MTSHELARRLLVLPDRTLVVVKNEGDSFVKEYQVTRGGPWVDAFEDIRVQIEPRSYEVQEDV